MTDTTQTKRMFHLLFDTNVRTRIHPMWQWQGEVIRFSLWKDESSVLCHAPQTLAAALRRSAAPGAKAPQTEFNGGENRRRSELHGAADLAAPSPDASRNGV